MRIGTISVGGGGVGCIVSFLPVRLNSLGGGGAHGFHCMEVNMRSYNYMDVNMRSKTYMKKYHFRHFSFCHLN